MQDAEIQPPPTPEAAEGSTIFIASAPGGGDPLVRQYLQERRQSSAFVVLSLPWLLLGGLATLAGGAYANTFVPAPEPLPPGSAAMWLQILHGLFPSLGATTLGMLAGGLLAALVARFVHRPGVPATHEPLLVMPLILIVYLLLRDPLVGLSLSAGALCLIYLGAMLFRLLALSLSIGRSGLRSDELLEPEGGWPVYTVLVPLYRETAVADKILKHLQALDYPPERLDVKFLLEADDPATREALQAAGLPPWAEILVVPEDQPKTKPRACNHGLDRARGAYLVIFDAEDRPEPDQLKQAVIAYAACEADLRRPVGRLAEWWHCLLFFRRPAQQPVGCLQAHLAYHNHRQNLLTRFFAIEYNVWFRNYLSGLQVLGGPIPLGGTSNHFRTELLVELGGWDPFNVTEDCDLGIRLHQAGYRTAILDSTTWEEANSRLGNWIRQRSRWLKGYMVTHLVWLRRPLQLFVRLGPWGSVCFFASIFGVAGLAVFNLLLWPLLAIYLVVLAIDLQAGYQLTELIISHRDSLLDPHRVSWPMFIRGDREDDLWQLISGVLLLASASLLAANVLFVLINLIFGRRPGQRGLIIAALLSPLYWVLISIGAWKGLWQLLTRPHYWEKTVHGLDASPKASDLSSEP